MSWFGPEGEIGIWKEKRQKGAIKAGCGSVAAIPCLFQLELIICSKHGLVIRACHAPCDFLDHQERDGAQPMMTFNFGRGIPLPSSTLLMGLTTFGPRSGSTAFADGLRIGLSLFRFIWR